MRSKPINILSFLLFVGACAPISYVSPHITLDLKIESLDGDSTSSLITASLESEDDEIATLAPKAFHLADLCYVVSATGSGIARDFVESSANSCENSFPGLGKLSQVFKFGDQPRIDVSY